MPNLSPPLQAHQHQKCDCGTVQGGEVMEVSDGLFSAIPSLSMVGWGGSGTLGEEPHPAFEGSRATPPLVQDTLSMCIG